MTRKEIKKIIEAVVALRNAATDEQANAAQDLYPEWEEGKEYRCGERLRHNGKLYKVSKGHIAGKKPNEDDVYEKIM